MREESIKARQEKVARLLARHMTVPEIAQALGVSHRTISYDIQAIRRHAARELAETSDVLTVAAGVDMRAERRMRDLSLLFMQADEIHDLETRIPIKLSILKELERQDTSRLVALQKLGVVQQAAREVVFDLKAAKMLNNIPQMELQRALSSPDTDQFLEVMAKALGPEALAEILDADVAEFQGNRLLGDGSEPPEDGTPEDD